MHSTEILSTENLFRKQKCSTRLAGVWGRAAWRQGEGGGFEVVLARQFHHYGTVSYVSTIQQDWSAQVARRGNGFYVSVVVGQDAEAGHTYSIVLGLDEAPGGILEYYFFVSDVDERNNTIRACHCGIESAAILPKVQRGAILRAVLRATKTLLGQANPVNVTWTTHDPDLPEKALVKYRSIVRVFESAGYKVEEGEPYHGLRIWFAERLNDPGFPFTKEGGENDD